MMYAQEQSIVNVDQSEVNIWREIKSVQVQSAFVR